MTTLLTYGRLVGFEIKCFRRNPPAAVLNFALPIVVVLILSATLTGHKQTLIPAGMTFGLLMGCYSQIAYTVVDRRDNLFLKRLRATPLRVSAYLGVMLAYALLLAAVLCALIYLVAVAVGGAPAPQHPAATVLTLAPGPRAHPRPNRPHRARILHHRPAHPRRLGSRQPHHRRLALALGTQMTIPALWIE